MLHDHHLGSQLSENTLRARRRQQTRDEIHRSAVELVLERGFAAVTVEDIAQAAGVSPRTFFNYFPTKQEAIFPGPPLLDADAVEAFVAGKSSLLADLRALVSNYAQLGPKVRKQMVQLRPILAEQPDIWIHMHKRFSDVENAFAQAVSRRQGHEAPTSEDRVIAAVTTGIMRASMRCWSLAEEHENPEALNDIVERNFEALKLLTGDQ